MREPASIREPRGRGLVAALIALMLVGTAVVSAWVVIDSGVLAPGSPRLGGPLAGASVDTPSLEQSSTGLALAGTFQLSQPRDPFRPLITPESPVIGPPGVGPGNGDFTPGGTTISLVDIRDVGGVLRATVTVNGTSYDVGIGDTFASVYRVVSLDDQAGTGVFMFGDNVFQLAVGQQILK